MTQIIDRKVFDQIKLSLSAVTEPAPKSGDIAKMKNPEPGVTARAVLKVISDQSGVSVQKLCAKGRGPQRIAEIRQVAMFEIYKRTTLSLPQIGRAIGNRHHTTVLHGIRAHEGRMQRLSEQKAQQ